MIKVFVRMNIQEKNLCYMLSVKREDTIFKEINEELMCPYMLLDQNCPLPYEVWNSALYNINLWHNEQTSKTLWHVMFGAYIPDIEVNDEMS